MTSATDIGSAVTATQSTLSGTEGVLSEPDSRGSHADSELADLYHGVDKAVSHVRSAVTATQSTLPEIKGVLSEVDSRVSHVDISRFIPAENGQSLHHAQ